MSDDMRRRLEDAGTRPVPAPAPGFADTLEARLRAVHGVAVRTGDPGPGNGRTQGPRRWRPRRRLALVALSLTTVAAIVVLAVGATRPGGGPDPSFAPTLTASVNVVVTLADGSVLEDPTGLILPDGAVITVGEGGSARIGGSDLEPGDVATVRGGRLEIRRPPWEPSSSAVAVAPKPASSSQPTPPPSGSATAGPTAAPTTRPTATPTTESADPASSPSATPTTAPTPTPTATVVIRRPRLRARLLDGPRVAVTWTATERARSYVLLVSISRSGPASDPVYPGSRELGTYAVPPSSPLRFRVPDRAVEVRLMVVALRRNGTVLRRSNIVTITIPATEAAAGSSSTSSPVTLDSDTPTASPSEPVLSSTTP